MTQSQNQNSYKSKLAKRTLSLISLQISLGSYKQLQDWIVSAAHKRESRSVCCANVHMVIEAKQKPEVA